MPAVCFFFQVHQPTYLKKISYLDKVKGIDYFDEKRIEQNIKKVATTSYIPTCKILLKLFERYKNDFRLSLSFSGIVLEQLQKYAPEALELFKQVVGTGCVEVLADTYHHSFAALYDEREYIYQLKRHQQLINDTFNVVPTVLCNSELLYSDRLGQLAFRLGYNGILTGVGNYQLGWRSPSFLYQGRGNDLILFVKNYQLSDDIAFRFSKHDWQEFPLTADKYGAWIHQVKGDIVNLFMDFETFGEHHWDTSGIFDFLECLPAEVLKDKDWRFVTPTQAISSLKPIAELVCPAVTSWGAVGNDLAAWMGGSLQGNALNMLYGLTNKVMASGDDNLIEAWRHLQTGDNFYYMLAGSYDSESGVRVSPYNNQSDAYINYINILRNIEEKFNQ